MDWILKRLELIKSEDLYRERIVSDNLINLCSNDYLGLGKNRDVIRACVDACWDLGVGSGASQLVSGYTSWHKKLEDKLKEFKGTEGCVLFGSGYLANIGAIPVLAEEGDLILSDELNHASIIDGCKLSKAEVRIFKHRDYEDLYDQLKEMRSRYRKVLIVTDSVFSMEGDVADISALQSICEEFDCMLYIDDAHSTGVLGKGKGSLQEFGVEWKENIIVMGTLSKAVGSYGAFICGSSALVEYIVNRVRSLIFSTSIPPHLCASAIKALEIIEKDVTLIEELKIRSEETYVFLKEKGVDVLWNGTPILPIIIGEEEKALKISEKLLSEGILLRAIRYPAVPKGKARLRLTVSLLYRRDEWFGYIDIVVNTLKNLKG